MSEVVLQLKMVESAGRAERFGHRVSQRVGAPFGGVKAGALGGFMDPAVQASGGDVRSGFTAGQKIHFAVSNGVQLAPQCAARGFRVDGQSVQVSTFLNNGHGPRCRADVLALDACGRAAAKGKVIHQAKGRALRVVLEMCSHRFASVGRMLYVRSSPVAVFWSGRGHKRGGIIGPSSCGLHVRMERADSGELHAHRCGRKLELAQMPGKGYDVGEGCRQDRRMTAFQKLPVLAGRRSIAFEGVRARAAYRAVEGKPFCQVVHIPHGFGSFWQYLYQITLTTVESVRATLYCCSAGTGAATCGYATSGFLASMQDNPDLLRFDSTSQSGPRIDTDNPRAVAFPGLVDTGSAEHFPKNEYEKGDATLGTVPAGADSRARQTARTLKAYENLTFSAEALFDAETQLIGEMNRRGVTAARRNELLAAAVHIYRATAKVNRARRALEKAVQA